jgi:hypothetical protein
LLTSEKAERGAARTAALPLLVAPDQEAADLPKMPHCTKSLRDSFGLTTLVR